ncbi:GWxTD domain-containing protein [bacterium]|nr:GWxTD domain-containing protein [bacterium]
MMKKNGHALVLLIVLLIISSNIWAIIDGFSLDVISFGGAEKNSITEIVWSINRGNLAFERLDSVWADTVLFDIEIFSKNKLIDSIYLKRIIQIPRGEMVSRDYLLFDKYSVALEPSEYKVVFVATDLGDGDTNSLTTEFEVKALKTELSMSDISLLTNVSRDSLEGPFTTNGLKMLPNPAKAFGTSFPTMYFYLEIYGLSKNDTIDVSYSVFDTSGNLVKEFNIDPKVSKDKSLPILNGLNVIGFPEGAYKLDVKAINRKKKLTSISSKSFSVIKTKLEPPNIVYRPDTTDIETEYKYISYLISTSEKKFYKKLSIEGKAEFLLRWWENRDPDLRTPENEFRQTVINRWIFANSTFKEGGDGAGWLTDRGRIYILYGSPDNIEKSEFVMESNPWEQWDYFALQGGVYFIFTDELGIGRYRLAHSTANGEIFNTSWLNELKNPHDTSREIEIK